MCQNKPRSVTMLVAAAGLLALTACGEVPTGTSAAPTVAPPRMHEGENHGPSAVITVQDFWRVEGIQLAIHAIASRDPDRDPLTYSWSFGDGSNGSGREVKHAYDDNGSYTLGLTVTDSHGASASQTMELRIANAGPEPGSLDINGPLEEGREFGLEVTGADDISPRDSDAGLDYSFDCGDGEWTSWSRDAQIGCAVYPDNTDVTFQARVRDKDHGSARTTIDTVIANAPPRLYVTNVIVRASRLVSIEYGWLDVVADSAHASEIVSWGDGNSTTRVTRMIPSANYTSHRYLAAGTYPVTLTLRDKDGGAATYSATVTVW